MSKNKNNHKIQTSAPADLRPPPRVSGLPPLGSIPYKGFTSSEKAAAVPKSPPPPKAPPPPPLPTTILGNESIPPHKIAKAYVSEQWLNLPQVIRSCIGKEEKENAFIAWELQFWREEYMLLKHDRDQWMEQAQDEVATG
jgi:hypothetical protein